MLFQKLVGASTHLGTPLLQLIFIIKWAWTAGFSPEQIFKIKKRKKKITLNFCTKTTNALFILIFCMIIIDFLEALDLIAYYGQEILV